MKKRRLMCILIVVIVTLSGCAKSNLNTPCPNFGDSCMKAPVNSWNNN